MAQGRDAPGFLAESTLLPRPAKPITGVQDGSILALQSVIQAHASRRQEAASVRSQAVASRQAEADADVDMAEAPVPQRVLSSVQALLASAVASGPVGLSSGAGHGSGDGSGLAKVDSATTASSIGYQGPGQHMDDEAMGGLPSGQAGASNSAGAGSSSSGRQPIPTPGPGLDGLLGPVVAGIGGHRALAAGVHLARLRGELQEPPRPDLTWQGSSAFAPVDEASAQAATEARRTARAARAGAAMDALHRHVA